MRRGKRYRERERKREREKERERDSGCKSQEGRFHCAKANAGARFNKVTD